MATIHPQAAIALRAAHLRRTCGEFASRRYAESRGCPTTLYELACALAFFDGQYTGATHI